VGSRSIEFAVWKSGAADQEVNVAKRPCRMPEPSRGFSRHLRRPKAMKVFLALAAIGLVLSLAVHALTFAGVNIPAAWLLHIGIFVVFVPAIVAANRMAKATSSDHAGDIVLEFAPTWLNCVTGVFFAYAFFNFFCLACLNEGGVPGRINGELVLHSHGKVIRKLSPEEFDKHEAYVTRGFSATWMLFYSASLLMLAASENAGKAPTADGESGPPEKPRTI
jgi:hypothetical protein